jgi:hypothetical protein
MARKPKLVPITALVPTYIRDLLKRLAKGEHRTLSAFVGTILIYHPLIRKELVDNGKEKEAG